MSGNGSRTRTKAWGTKGPFLPTPRACDGLRAGVGNQTELLMSVERLMSDVQRGFLLPTPTASDVRDGTKLRKDNNLAEGGRHGVGLNHLIENLAWGEASCDSSTCARGSAGSASPEHGSGGPSPASARSSPTATGSLPTTGPTCHGTTTSGPSPRRSSGGGLPFQTPTVEDATRQGSPEWAERWANGETPPTTHQRLRTQVLLPTPHANCHTGAGHQGRDGGLNLQTAVQNLGVSPAASPASPSPSPASSAASTTPATSGPPWQASLTDSALTGPIGSSLRTCLGSSGWRSTICSMTWSASATPRGRSLYRLRVSVRSTAATGSGSSQDATMLHTPTGKANQTSPDMAQWPGAWVHQAGMIGTPTAAMKHRSPEHAEGRAPNPKELANRMLPTPQHEGFDAGAHRGSADSLHAVAKMLPTPTMQDGKNNGGPSQWERNSDPLNVAVQRNGTPGKLNPDFVCRLMGFPDSWLDIGEGTR